jgi:hypothetical protein
VDHCCIQNGEKRSVGLGKVQLSLTATPSL